MKGLKVAIIVEELLDPGGTERVLESIIDLFPNSEIFTSWLNIKNYDWIKVPIHRSSLDIPVLRKLIYGYAQVLKPFAIESHNLEGFDVVISLSPFGAHGVITGIYQPHISIIFTPSRMLWENEFNVRGNPLRLFYRFFGSIVNHFQRIWATTATERVDHFISISTFIQKKLQKIYRKDSVVIHPGVNMKWFEGGQEDTFREEYGVEGDYFLVVSRLWDYKRVDMALRACIESDKQLVIIGDGPDLKYLRKIAKKHDTGNNILFLGRVDDSVVKGAHAGTQALIHCAIEDYGLTPLEANASGTPVLAFNEGGVLDTVIDGEANQRTGAFFSSEEDLVSLLEGFNKEDYNKDVLIKHAKLFSDKVFKDKLLKFVEKIWQERRN